MSSVTATIWAWYFSASQGMATDVSSPPEYAKTIRSIVILVVLKGLGSSQAPLSFRVRFQAVRERRRAPGVARDDENRVVARNRARGFRELCAIGSLGERLRLPPAGSDDDQLLGALRAGVKHTPRPAERPAGRPPGR